MGHSVSDPREENRFQLGYSTAIQQPNSSVYPHACPKSNHHNKLMYNANTCSGQERFRSITASYFRKADGIILMYDVTDKRSYLNVRNWMSTIADTAAENVAVLLVGNKIDLRKNENKAKCVPTEEGLRLAREYDIVFLETSVKTGTNLLPSMGKLIR